jgi:hypothetical protein
MPNPLFATYRQGENRVTASILAVLERLPFSLTERILQALCEEPERPLLHFNNQPTGVDSRPDARIGASFAYWLETKIVPNGVRESQIRAHLQALDGESRVERQRLLVLTPDARLPKALAAINDPRVAWANFDDLLSIIRDTADAAGEWLATDKPTVSEQDRVLLKELARFLILEGLVGRGTDQVLVVAARVALDEYRRYSAYVCQPNRSFRPVSHMAFYRDGTIAPMLPKVLDKVESIVLSHEGISSDPSMTGERRGRLTTLIESGLRPAVDERLGKEVQVIFLSEEASPDTLRLQHPVRNMPTSDGGRSQAFVQGHRYVPLANFLKNPRTTSELVRAPI